MGRLVVLLHVLVAFWLVAGFIGRNLTLLGARTSGDLAQVTTLTTLAARFDRLMVIPGSLVVFVLGLLAAWAAGVPLAMPAATSASCAGLNSTWPWPMASAAFVVPVASEGTVPPKMPTGSCQSLPTP